MTQQYINFGSFPDDPNADSIRESFQKVQDNFTDLYTNSLKQGVLEVVPGFGLRSEDDRITGNLVLYANIPNVTVSTPYTVENGLTNLRVKPRTSPSYSNIAIITDATPIDIDLAPNIKTSNANFTHTTTTANLVVNGKVKTNLIPEGDEQLDLGSPLHKWRDLYLSGNTLSIGAQKISSDTTGFIMTGSVVTDSISVGTVEAQTVLGNITTTEQTLVTKVGTLTELAISGDTSSQGNIRLTGNLESYAVNASTMTVAGAFTAGTITGNIVLPPGATIDAPGGEQSNMQIIFNDGGKQAAVPGLAYNKTDRLLTIQGNVEGGNLNTSGALAVSGTATVGGLATGGSIHANTGAISGGSIISLGVLTATSTITGGNVSTSGYLEVTGNASVGNITTTNIDGVKVSVTGNISGANLVASGILKVDGAANVGSLTTSGQVSAATLRTTADAQIDGNYSSVNGNITLTNGKLSGASLYSTGLADITGDLLGRSNIQANGILTVLGNSSFSNMSASGNLAVTGNSTVSGTHTVTGNITAANFTTAGGAYITGILRAGDSNMANVNAAGSLTATSTITGGNLTTGGTLSVTSNATVGNLNTGGLISATGNITGGNFITTGATKAASLEITSGGASITGTVTGTLFSGNGASLTNLNSTVLSTTITTTAAAGTGSVVTLSYVSPGFIPFYAGQSITVSGVVPSAYNGTFTVVSASTTQVTFNHTATGTQTSAGRIVGGSRSVSAQVADSATTAGTATTVTGASQTNITTLGTLTGLTLNGSGSISGAASISGGNVQVTSYFLHSLATGISATGTTIGGAFVLSKEVNVITTSSAGVADGVQLPVAPSTHSLQVVIINASTSSINVYPSSSAQIDGLGTSNPAVVGAGGKLVVFSTSPTQWYSLTSIYA